MLLKKLIIWPMGILTNPVGVHNIILTSPVGAHNIID